MPSGFNDTIANDAVDWAIATAMPNTAYMDLLTTAPTDDNGTGAVAWGQGRVAVDMTDTSIWPAAADRQTSSAPILSAVNTSGATITVVAFAFYSASTSGIYLNGAPLDGGTLDVDDGSAAQIVITLASPSPSE